MELILNQSNNQFKGLKHCLNLNFIVHPTYLDAAYDEVKYDKEKLKMFYSLLFSIGDVASRQHNIFKNKRVDSGGNSKREEFEIIVQWMFNNNKEQFIKFLNAGLFNEYSTFDVLLKNRIKTKNGCFVNATLSLKNPEYRTILANYFETIIKGNNEFNKSLIAKFLTLPRLGKRKNHTLMRKETKEAMRYKCLFLKELSDKVGWRYNLSNNYANFSGYKKWRKQYNQEFESVLFSTKKIFDMNRDEFIDWIDKIPALARMRVVNKLKAKSEYKDLYYWYSEWNNYKEYKQSEFRELQEKIRQNIASDEEKAKFEIVKKEAKVNVGAINFEKVYNDICDGRIDKLKLETFVNTKVNLPYNSLVIIDDSGSMVGKPFNFATFVAAVCLYKNPDDTARNLLGFFDDNSHWYTSITKISKTKNSLLKNVSIPVTVPFINPELNFYDNFIKVKSFCNSVFRSGCTNISSIVDGLNIACKHNTNMLESLRNYPVWTIISDGEFNQCDTPKESMQDFMKKCQKYFGFKPFVILIDITCRSYYDDNCIDKFDGIENVIHISNNVGQIEQLLTNFKDGDCFNAYYPLLAVYRSNRYEIVRKNVI